ncbi:phage-associated protein, family [Klebsiella michiganensis]|nr:phage-associated protein, family [Klebsiella michiganensis]
MNQCRDNRGAFAVNNDKEKPETWSSSAPLSPALMPCRPNRRSTCQQYRASRSSSCWGITPNGLNATSDGEIRVFYDYIHALQQSVFKDNLKRVMDIIQLSEFGDIDDGITFDFEPLYEMSAKERAEIRKVDADTDAVYVTSSVLSGNEVREKIAGDPDSPYHSLDLK